jgi:hypothetical protein
MAKRKPVQAAVSQLPPGEAPPKKLSWEEEKFVGAYVRNGSNATRAFMEARPGTPVKTASTLGTRMLGKVWVYDAIEEERARLREVCKFTRDEYFTILAGMARATLDDFAQVFEDPTNRENYCGLGEKKFAIESAKKTVNEDAKGNVNIVNEIKIVSPGERKAIANELWEKLGLGQEASSGNWFDGLDKLAELVRGSKKP